MRFATHRSATVLLLGAALCVAACSDDNSSGAANGGSTAGGDAAQDAGGQLHDAAAGDSAGGGDDAKTEADVQADGGDGPGPSDTDATTGPCPGSHGCACTGNADCDGGYCIATLAGKVCAAKCVEDCPAGQSCSKIKGADELFWCVPQWGLLCRPCNDDADCDAPGVGDAACVKHGTDGGYCGASCEGDTGCPSGYTCETVERTKGGATQQCVQGGAKAAPTCACGPAAQKAAWFTDCWLAVDNAAGETIQLCPGTRTCGPAGLSACVKNAGAACVAAQCLTDGVPGGAPLKKGTPCDDGVACTVADSCDGQGNCVPGSSNCQCTSDGDCADDGNPCTGVPYCDTNSTPAVCKTNPATVVTCQSGKDTACAKNLCQAATGKCAMVASPDGTACDDGDLCTKGDACAKGSCGAGVVTCTCKAQADCAPFEDGDACNGTLYCDLASGTCKVNPATAVPCPSVDDTGCQKNTCFPKTGACAMVAKPGAACDDGNACTTGDACSASGGCTPGTNACVCKADADCAAKEDGNPCNGTLFCDKNLGACAVIPATVLTCPTNLDQPCLKNVCDPKNGKCAMTQSAEGEVCDDGDACTEGELCKGGQCTPKHNACACKVTADCAQYEDGDLCNGTLYCHASGECRVNPATVVSCPDTTQGEAAKACLVNACQHSFDAQGQTTGAACKLVPRPNGLLCEDGNPCSEGDVCIDGQCAAGKKVCACLTDKMCAPDGPANLCVSAAKCVQGQCVPGVDKACPTDDDTACIKALCEPATGKCALQPVNQAGPCDDGDVCTSKATCKGGSCQGGVPLKCDDGNTCTKDSCDPKIGCLFAGQTGPCDDGNPCTVDDACVDKTCKGTAAKETCEGKVDEDCDGATDEEGAVGCTPHYLDHDGDKAAANASKCLCGPTGKYVVTTKPTASTVDCNDNDKTMYPGATETCSAKDLNCDGHPFVASQGDLTVGLSGSKAWYADKDKDGFSTNKSLKLCKAAGVYVLAGPTKLDCDDNNAKRNPNVSETCATPYDDNCNGKANEAGAIGETLYYYDADGDQVPGNKPKTKMACAAVKPYTGLAKYKQLVDCDDSDPLVHPNQTKFFTGKSKHGLWDYNCDYKVTKQYAVKASCPSTTDASVCKAKGVPGWVGDVPACGVTAVYSAKCVQLVFGGACKPQEIVFIGSNKRTQGCR